MMYDFSKEASIIKRLDADTFNRLYKKYNYYRPRIHQYFEDKLISVPTDSKLVLLAQVPIVIKVVQNQELLNKYNLVADPFDLSAVLSVGWFELHTDTKPMQGDVFEYSNLRFEILKVIEFDFYKTTNVPIHYLVTCARYREEGFVRDVHAPIKDIMPAKTADMYDSGMRELDLVKDPDNPNFVVKN